MFLDKKPKENTKTMGGKAKEENAPVEERRRLRAERYEAKFCIWNYHALET